MLKAKAYNRYVDDEITRGSFFFIIGCILSWGFAAIYMVSKMTVDWKPDLFSFLLVGLGLPLIGIFMSGSGSAVVSFAGFNLVAIPFGAILGPALATYELAKPGIVSEAAMLTAAVTGLMTLSGLLFPDFYRSIGGALFAALIALVGVSVLSLFVPALQQFTLIHYIAAGIFALYIGYDMHRASELPATLDNAVDVCVNLYLDILNLFLRILAILKSDDD